MIISVHSDSVVEKSIETLLRNGVAVLPCDTMYGLCGRVPSTAERLREIKRRSADQQFVVLLPEMSSVASLVAGEIDCRLTRHWPGPLTVVALGKTGETVAIRVPDDPFLSDIMKETGPLYATSVNQSGHPYLLRISDIVREFQHIVDLIVDAGDFEASMPSTIVDATVSPWKVLRSGAVVV